MTTRTVAALALAALPSLPDLRVAPAARPPATPPSSGRPLFTPAARVVMESTASLLELIREGDAAAEDRLLRRLLPMLQRWATGRLPAGARDLVDTNDLIQSTLVRSLRHLPEFESRHEGALLVYLRRAVLNQIRDHARRVKRQPAFEPLPDDLVSAQPSPLEQAVQAQALARYEAALEHLTPAQRQAVVLRLEMGYAYPQLAEAVGVPSPDAARMLVTRGLVALAAAMQNGGEEA